MEGTPMIDSKRGARARGSRKAAGALAALLATLAVALALAGGGCLSRQVLVKESFAFGSPPIAGPAPAAGGRVLGLRLLEVAAPFEGRSLVYRTGEHSYELDPYAEFLVPPRRGLSAAIRGWLRKSGAVSEVVEPESVVRPDLRAEVLVSDLYGDLRSPKEPASVLALRFIVLDPAPERAGRILLQKDYARRIPIKERSAAAVMDGWDKALEQILSEIGKDLESLK
jgi:cholesterol transport system auxiliary component